MELVGQPLASAIFSRATASIVAAGIVAHRLCEIYESVCGLPAVNLFADGLAGCFTSVVSRAATKPGTKGGGHLDHLAIPRLHCGTAGPG